MSLAGPALGRDAHTVMEAYRAGRLAAPMALFQLLRLAGDVPLLQRWLDTTDAAELSALLERNGDGATAVLEILADPDDAPLDPARPAAALARVERLFDRAVRRSPEASVALFSFGSPALLATVTAGIVALATRHGLVAPGHQLLDLGCGIGRVAAAVAPLVAGVTGVDLSAGMLAEAARRCAPLPNVRLLQASAHDLRALPDGGHDAVLAVDSLPYLERAGREALLAAALAEVARVLRPGGRFLALNWSYRGDPARDRAEAAALATAEGLTPDVLGEAELAEWDGLSFLFTRR